jgi:hypothetical protein
MQARSRQLKKNVEKNYQPRLSNYMKREMGKTGVKVMSSDLISFAYPVAKDRVLPPKETIRTSIVKYHFVLIHHSHDPSPPTSRPSH